MSSNSEPDSRYELTSNRIRKIEETGIKNTVKSMLELKGKDTSI